MKEKIKVLCCVLLAVFVWIKNHILRKKNNSKKVLILFQQIFGDAILIADSLKYYTSIYPESEGYQITFVSKPIVNAFMHDVLFLPEDISFEEVDFKRIQTDIKYFKNVIKRYSDSFGTIIVPGTSFSPELFSITSTAKKRVGLLPSTPRTKPYALVWLQKQAYNSTIIPDKNSNMIQRHRMLLNYLGLKDVRGTIPNLKPLGRIIEGKYCVVCPGSSMSFKIWPIDRFVSVINYIINEYNMDVYLTGGKGEEKYADLIIRETEYPEKIVSKIGDTSFAEWSSIVQHASLVLGNDSATIHMAAAARKPSICIAGIYEKNQFFPYTVDYLEENGILPYTIYKTMKCENCRALSYFAGYGNTECKERIKKGDCASCIEAITVDEVIRTVKGIMEGTQYD